MDDQNNFIEIMNDIYSNVPRQGPGSAATTLKALQLCTELSNNPTVLDIGCGTGTQTITLANAINGTIMAIDLMPKMIDVLSDNLRDKNLKANIQPAVGDMSQLDVAPQSIDLIWSEGAAYSIGFENAISYWKQFLKSDGYLAVSELVWLESDPPEEAIAYWRSEYPDMQSVDTRLKQFGESGYEMVDHFTLPYADWEAYYQPIADRLPELYKKYENDALGSDIITGIEAEIEIRRRFPTSYSYEFFIARPEN